MADKKYYDLISSNGGRPKKVINEFGLQMVESLSRIMCTEEEICSIIEMSADTIHNDDNNELFRTACEKGRLDGKASLRRLQYQSAQKGNVTMQIWLGKQYLGQAEKIEADVTTDEEKRKEMKAFMESIKYGKKEN